MQIEAAILPLLLITLASCATTEFDPRSDAKDTDLPRVEYVGLRPKVAPVRAEFLVTNGTQREYLYTPAGAGANGTAACRVEHWSGARWLSTPTTSLEATRPLAPGASVRVTAPIDP